MRVLSLFLLSLIITVSAYSESVSKNEAQTIALAWINSVEQKDFSDSNIDALYVREFEGDTVLFVVAFDEDAWVMVSGTNRVEPVLAYSGNTPFNFNQIPIQLEEWMWSIEQEIDYAKRNRIQPDATLLEKWEQLRENEFRPATLKSAQTTVAPLLTSNWNQGRYFNEMAPPDAASSTGNGHTWIGCVGTAMAQIMKYWHYPQTGMGANSYTHPVYGHLSADFENSLYNWDEMPDVLTSGNAEVQKISYHAAVSVNMQFHPYGSGAFLEDALIAMPEYFRYNTSIYYVHRSRWDEDEAWEQLLRNELNSGRPIIYAGYNQTGSSGHAFVCDGYSGNYFHFNWGWGGASNGNFLLSALTPGGSNYTYTQSALLGIEPVLPKSISTPLVEDFETANTSFSLSGIVSVSSSESHTGNRSLQFSKPSFSSYSLNTASLTFLVPANGNLSFWVKRNTPDVSIYNNQKAVIKAQHGNSTLIEFFNGDFNDEQWVNYTADLAPYAGQIVRLVFKQQNFDNYREQWMYVDNVTLTGTNQNLAPFEPRVLSPENHITGVSFNPEVKWLGGDPNGDSLTYHVYFGNTQTPGFLGTTSDQRFAVSDLEHSTTYYWKIIADDGALQTESPLWSFTTQGIPPQVKTCGPQQISSNSATICGQILSDNGYPVISKGFAWSKVPFTLNPQASIENHDEDDLFYSQIENLEPYTNYYVRAFATNSEGTAYGEQLLVTTLPGKPVVSVATALDLKRTSAKIVANIERINDSVVSEKGIVWDLSSEFDVNSANTHYVEGRVEGIADFTALLNNLPGPDTLRYRAFATNSAGTAYSDEHLLVLTNNAPVVNLDPNNRSGSLGIHFNALAVEFMQGGIIADDDLTISDFDGDTIQNVQIILTNNVYNEEEFLVYTGSSEGVSVQGNNSHLLHFEKTADISNSDWENIIRHVEYRIEHHAPVSEILREVHVIVSDGYDQSQVAKAFVCIIPVNDPPVCHTPPALDAPVFGTDVNVIPGTWVDELDDCEGEMTFEYWWQARIDGEIVDSIAINSPTFTIADTLCGHQIRVVEYVYDSYCGGANTATAFAKSDWYSIEKAQQTILFDNISAQPFSYKPLKLSGSSSSGLPLVYRTTANDIIDIVDDEVYMKTTGRAPISAYQPGNNCFHESATSYKVLVIEKGIQEILYSTHYTAYLSQEWTKLNIESSSGLPVSVEVSDTSIASYRNDTLFFNGIGFVSITLTQAGDENIGAADTVHFTIEIQKGVQYVEIDYQTAYAFSNEAYPIDIALSSGLEPLVQSSDSTIFIIENNTLITTGTGLATIEISHQGNHQYEAMPVQFFPLEITKGNQRLDFQIDDSIEYGNQYAIRYELSSGLDLDLHSYSTDLLEFENDFFITTGVGSAYIHYSNSGNYLWNLLDTIIIFNVEKANQQLYFPDSLHTKLHNEFVEIEHKTSAGLLVDFEIANPQIAHFNGTNFELNNAGSTVVYVNESGNSFYNQYRNQFVLDVERGTQIIEIKNMPPLVYGHQAFDLNVEINSGLPVNIRSNNEKVFSVSEQTLHVHSVGSAEIVFSQAGNDNWYSTILSLHVSVNKAAQQLFTDLPDTLEQGSYSAAYFYSSSGLEISKLQSSDESILQITSDSLFLTGNGWVEVEAQQEGNENYLAANQWFNFYVDYTNTLKKFEDLTVSLFPNPVSDVLHISLNGKVDYPLSISVLNVLGGLVKQTEMNRSFCVIETSDLKKGIYFVVLRSPNYYKIEKITVH